MSRRSLRLAQLAAIAVGVWLMASPSVLGYEQTSAGDVHRVVGPIVASVALISLSHATRGVARVNALAGVVLLLTPLGTTVDAAAIITSVATGITVLLLAFVPSPTGPSQGGGWSELVAAARERTVRR